MIASMFFPLPFVPQASYHKPPRPGHNRWFGAPRDGGTRKHAACDLLAPLGTDVFAMEDGEVLEVSPHFYTNVAAVALRHTSGMVARYCEVTPESIQGLQRGTAFRAGDIIAKVGKMRVDSMLHLELYAGTGSGRLSVSGNAFNRRSDLIDPTPILDRLRGRSPTT